MVHGSFTSFSMTERDALAGINPPCRRHGIEAPSAVIVQGSVNVRRLWAFDRRGARRQPPLS